MALKLKEIDDINKLRKLLGLKCLEIKLKKCLRCETEFKSYSRSLCPLCRRMINQLNLNNAPSQNAELYQSKMSHYMFGSKVYDSIH